MQLERKFPNVKPPSGLNLSITQRPPSSKQYEQSPVASEAHTAATATARHCLMPISSALFDLLAPRLFRQSAQGFNRGVRRGWTAVAARAEEGRGKGAEETEEVKEDSPIAGPSRLMGRSQVPRRRTGEKPSSYASSKSWQPAHKLLRPTTASLPRIRTTDTSHDDLDVTRRRPPLSPAPSLAPYFASPNPLPPSELYQNLTDQPTRSNGDLLARFARRVDDRRTESAVKDHLGRLRIAPVGWISKSLPKRRTYPFPERIQADEDVQGEQGFGSGDDPPLSEEVPRKQISPELKALRASSNRWARGMWPPIPGITTFEAITPHDFLCRQHHRILYSSNPPTFISALRRLEQMSGIRDRDLLSLLHLHLAYPNPQLRPRPYRGHEAPPHMFTNAPEPPSPLLTPLSQFLLHAPHIAPTRQTLHLLIITTLATCYPRAEILLEPSRKARISEIVTLFRTQWGISPACETWRHTTQYAIHLEDHIWAKESWDGWWSARARGDWRAERDESSEGAMGAADRGEDVEDVLFRFKHRGREIARWFKVVKTLAQRGWLKERDLGEGVDRRIVGKEGWEWVVGREGETDLTASSTTHTDSTEDLP